MYGNAADQSGALGVAAGSYCSLMGYTSNTKCASSIPVLGWKALRRNVTSPTCNGSALRQVPKTMYWQTQYVKKPSASGSKGHASNGFPWQCPILQDGTLPLDMRILPANGNACRNHNRRASAPLPTDNTLLPV